MVDEPILPMGFQGREEPEPSIDLIILIHPLVPTKSWSVHIKGGYLKAFLFWCIVVIKKLGNFEDPTKGVNPIKSGNFKFHVWVTKTLGGGVD